MAPIRLDQRKRWVRVAEHIARASNIDEKEIHAQLNELERLINEAQTIDQSTTQKITANP